MQKLRMQPSQLKTIPTEMGVNSQYMQCLVQNYRITPGNEVGIQFQAEEYALKSQQ